MSSVALARYLVFALAVALFATPTRVEAQPAPCRDVSQTDDVLADLNRPLFFDVDESGVYEQLRTSLGIQRLAADTPVTIINDVAVCEAWLPVIAAALKTAYGPDEATEGYLFQMVQYGPYMAVTGGTDRSNSIGGEIHEFTPVFIFNAATRRYLGKIGV